MSTQELIERHKKDAEIYNGESLCKQKSHGVLAEIDLPKGLLPLNDLIEVGYNRTSGFVWLKQKKKTDHKFRSIGRNVSYETEVTAFVEKRRMRRLTGVKSKEIFIWITISDIYVDDSNLEKVTFATPSGLSRTFPISAFDLDADQK